ncbi:D-amino acid dehydrogenase [Ideonella azotifigens]|uniref:D-amino acid dehydrogenase n=1 Tax=Ideonella azotifigens TaxID=513160 RepID=A0ABN1K9C4_9BURK|nr:D-amino acid dehydrogenase [Ideonella azotifigens]MCD2339062.1 D-amino acid dehydrogenase [Ideonella azotifigens]
MKVGVIGAGLIGCATAYALAREGHEVLLLDAASGPGQAASRANGAQLSYSYVEPLASPGTLRGLPRLLLDPASPLRVRPVADWRQWAWGLQFLAACTTAQVQRGTVELLALARMSRQTLEAWLAEEAWDIAFARNGKLVLCASEAGLAAQRRQIDFQASHGAAPQQVLTADECIAREPALAGQAGQMVGGVWTESECVADPFALCHALLAGLLRLGGQAHFNCTVSGFVTASRKVRAVRSSLGEIEADHWVLATGSQSAQLAKPLGLRLPVWPLKGYSLTLPLLRPERAPRASVTDLSRKTVFAPLAGQLRVAAMAELGGHGLDIPPQRVAQMLASVEALFPGACDLDQPRPWAGLRPATPTGLPLIGAVPAWDNLLLNTGHGALGLTLAAGSAARVCEWLRRP